MRGLLLLGRVVVAVGVLEQLLGRGHLERVGVRLRSLSEFWFLL